MVFAKRAKLLVKQHASRAAANSNNNSGGGYDTLSLWNDELAAEFVAAETKRMRIRKKEKGRKW
jgi:hypothetical protein